MQKALAESRIWTHTHGSCQCSLKLLGCDLSNIWHAARFLFHSHNKTWLLLRWTSKIDWVLVIRCSLRGPLSVELSQCISDPSFSLYQHLTRLRNGNSFVCPGMSYAPLLLACLSVSTCSTNGWGRVSLNDTTPVIRSFFSISCLLIWFKLLVCIGSLRASISNLLILLFNFRRSNAQYQVGERRCKLIVLSYPSIGRHSHLQTVTEGKLCTTQAVLKQIGINGVSFTYVQTFHTLPMK